jgi:hypothetical protein
MEKNEFDYLKGKELEEAKKLVKPYLFIVEVNRDGHSEYINAQYVPNRIQVETVGGIITKIVDVG